MRALVSLTLAVVALATPALAQDVEVEFDRDYAFPEIRTYAWAEPTQADPNRLAHEQIVAAIGKQLERAGVREAGPGIAPDALVTYRSNSEDVFEISAQDLGSDGAIGVFFRKSPTFARGTLVIEIRDARTSALVFTGVATDTVDTTPGPATEKIDQAVAKIVRQFQQRIVRDSPDLRPFEGRIVEGIDLTNFSVTKEYVIRREIRHPVGEPLDLEVVDADVVRLENLNIFAQIRVDIEELDGGIRLVYRFKEMPSFIPFPAFTFTEENGFSVGVGTSALNMTGRDVQVSARALFGGTTTYRLFVGYPWITGNHVSVDFFAAHLVRQDEVRGFEETSDELTPWVGTYFAGDRGRLKGTFSFFRMQSDVDGVTITPDNDDQLRRIGLAAGWDTRDSWRNPRHGWQNELQVFRTGGFLGGEGNFWTVDADVRRFQPIGDRSALVIGSLLTLQTGEAFVDVPSYMRFHLGGANSIRGYNVTDQKRFSGKNQYLGTIEYRHTVLPLRRWDVLKWSFNLGIELAAFGDVGHAWDTSDQFSLGRFRGGAGLGLRLLVPGSEQTRLDVGWSREGGFQFHFGNWSKLSGQRFRLR